MTHSPKKIPLELKIASVIFLYAGVGAIALAIYTLVLGINLNEVYIQNFQVTPSFVFAQLARKFIVGFILIGVAYFMRKGNRAVLWVAFFMGSLLILCGFGVFLLQWVDWGMVRLMNIPFLVLPLMLMVLLVSGYRKLGK